MGHRSPDGYTVALFPWLSHRPRPRGIGQCPFHAPGDEKKDPVIYPEYLRQQLWKGKGMGLLEFIDAHAPGANCHKTSELWIYNKGCRWFRTLGKPESGENRKRGPCYPAMGATPARVSRTRSSGATESWSPLRPAETPMVSKFSAEASTTVFNCFFCPKGLTPPVI